MHDSNESDHFLQSVLEGFVDGILVLTENKEVIYANSMALNLCAKLLPNQADPLPNEIWRVCAALLESRNLYPSHPMMIEAEVIVHETTFQIRAQWLTIELVDRPCVLVRLQDQEKSVQGLAIAEIQRWKLTPREAEVWLLRRSGYSRKGIAAELCIALDTVKKHLKNIGTKRQIRVDEEAWQSNRAC